MKFLDSLNTAPAAAEAPAPAPAPAQASASQCLIRGPRKIARSGRRAYTYFLDEKIIEQIEQMSTCSTTIAIESLLKIALAYLETSGVRTVDYQPDGLPILSKK